MTVKVIECEQGTPEWFQARLGIPTASEFDTVLSGGKARRTYMLKLIGERMTDQPQESYSNYHMQRGKDMEQEARDAYCFHADVDVEQVGFIRNGRAGCSPDGLVGKDGMVELKTKLPHIHFEVLIAGVLPPEHVAQVQGALWVAEREWCDFVSYWPKLPIFVKRVHRDEVYIKGLAKAVKQFNKELDELQKFLEAK